MAAVAVAAALTAGGAALVTAGAVQAATDSTDAAVAVEPVTAVAPPDAGVATDTVTGDATTTTPTDSPGVATDTAAPTDTAPESFTLTTVTDPVPVVDQPAVDVAVNAGTTTVAIKFGQSLTCNDTPPAGQQWTYQWLRDDGAIAGATGCAYTVALGDIGHEIWRQTTVTQAGQTPTTIDSGHYTVVKADFTQALGTLTGTPTVGEVVKLDTTTAKTCSYFGTTPPTVTYTWLRDGVAFQGPNTGGYQLTPADAGHQVALQVSCSAPGHNDASATTPPTATVAKRDLTILSLTIPSSLTIGQTGIQPGYSIDKYFGFGNTPTLAWQWLRDGQAIPGATAIAYDVTSADVGHSLSVRLTATLPGYNDAVMTSNAVTVGSGVFEVSVGPLLGTPQVGQKVRFDSMTSTLCRYAGSTQPTATFAWLSDNTVITGQSASDYLIKPADVGHQIALRVTCSLAGYSDASATSPTVTAAKGTMTLDPVSVKTARVPVLVGDTVTHSDTTVHFMDFGTSPVWSYQWLRNGTPIAGATAGSYQTVTADKGAQLAVRVTVSVDGFNPVSQTSDPVTVEGNPVILTDVKVVGTAKVGQQIAVQYTGQTGATFTYQWLRNGQPIPGETNISYVITSADQNCNLSVRVTGTAAGYDPSTVTTTPILMWDLKALMQPIMDMLQKWLAQLLSIFPQVGK